MADPPASDRPRPAPTGRGRRGLGRGLAALLGEGVEALEGVGAEAGFAPALRELELTEIRPNPEQPRARIAPEALASLAASIRSHGVVQPVVVRPLAEGTGYELVAGERRWRAAAAAGLARIPALVRDADARERLELALTENVVRADLSAIEVAHAVATLIEDFGQSQAALAERLGRSRPAISNLLRLLELPEDVQALVEEGRISEGHARAILMADGARARRALAARVLAEDLSVRATEAAARGAVRRSRAHRPAGGPVAEAARDGFADAFDVPVRVRRSRGGGVVVELRFADEEALAGALDRLAGED